MESASIEFRMNEIFIPYVFFGNFYHSYVPTNDTCWQKFVVVFSEYIMFHLVAFIAHYWGILVSVHVIFT